jgi:hypothetical protein
MEFTTVVIAVLVVGLFAAMTTDFILDLENIWNSQFEIAQVELVQDEVIEVSQPVLKAVATISWVNVAEDSQDEVQVDVIEIAKSRIKVKPVISAGVKVRQLLDSLGKSVQVLVDYSAMTIRELKLIAKERRLPKYGSMRKAELVAALSS